MRFQLERFSIVDRLIGLIERRKSSDKLILRVLFFATVFSGIYYLYTVNSENSFPTPNRGGSLVEGVVGIPRFVNPALAITRADQDIVAIVYSGLLKIDTEGELVPDIAQNVSVSEDGLTYQVTLRQDRKFHDGTPITANDAIFTIKLVQNSDLKSPLRGNWSEVELEQINEYEFNVVLDEAYSPFIENFTLGIMPQHIWGNLPIEQLPFSQYNTEPVGSGYFSIKQVNRDASGLISGYSLKPEPNNQVTPNLASIEMRFFQNEELLKAAFVSNEVNSTAYLSSEFVNELDTDDVNVLTEPLPRIFGLFFNQNHSPALRDKAARQAINKAINRDRLVDDVLLGFGVPTTKPIIGNLVGLESTSTEAIVDTDFSQEAAREILIKGGWEQNEAGFWEKEIDKSTETLSLTIKTSNAPLFEKSANLIAEDLRELGVEVQIDQYEQTGLVQSVIRTRDFQVLLFGIDMNRTQDLYPFWHSSQRDDPGLNVAQYTNITVDRLLEKTRNSQDKDERQKLLYEASETINAETPTVFLFAPSIAYVVDKNIITAPMHKLGKASDRFMNVSDWYAKTEVVWPIFQKEDNN